MQRKQCQNFPRTTKQYIRVLNHYTANASHCAQAVCSIFNWNIFVLKQNSMLNDNDILSELYNKISLYTRAHPCSVYLGSICNGYRGCATKMMMKYENNQKVTICHWKTFPIFLRTVNS